MASSSKVRVDKPEVALVNYTVLYKNSKGQPVQTSPLTEDAFEKVQESVPGTVLEVKKTVRAVDQAEGPPQNVSKTKVMNAESSTRMPPLVDIIEAEEIIIYSPLLIKAVKQAVRYWPSHGFVRAQKIMVLDRPYRSLGAYHAEINELADKYNRMTARQVEDGKSDGLSLEECKKTANEIKLLMHEVDKAQKEYMDEEIKRLEKEEPVASFDSLWMLFKPGTIVYHNTGSEEVAYVVKICQWASESQTKPGDPITVVKIWMWNLDFNGTNINRRKHSVAIHRFEGECKIQDLPVYPEIYAAEYDSKRARREARGKKYFQYLAGPVPCLRYTGYLSGHESDPNDSASQRWYEGRVIVDPYLHAQENGFKIKSNDWESESEAKFGGVTYEDFVKIDPKRPKSPLKNDHYFLLPQYIRGFTLDTRQTREWVFLDVECTDKLVMDKSLIKTLAIDAQNSKSIQALTARRFIGNDESQGERKGFAADSIQGKGAGRIIMLHGTPGVGKTYTAECIAEWSGRPMMRVTCTELGINPTKLEQNLQKCFRRAEKWDAIILIDEADVFVEQRHASQPLEKDAITAVFLRALEYYRGILFLTTNRMLEFDDAIQSRASLILRFERLNLQQKEKIRQSRIDRLKQTGRYNFLTGADEEFRLIDTDEEFDWSGRDIITVIQTAVALAEFEAGESVDRLFLDGTQIDVGKGHIKNAIAPIKDFAKYRKERHNELEEMASRRNAR